MAVKGCERPARPLQPRQQLRLLRAKLVVRENAAMMQITESLERREDALLTLRLA
jgi:hypothetical protein